MEKIQKDISDKAIERAKKPYAVDGEFCSACGTELGVELDEDWDEFGFVILPYPFCYKLLRC